MPIPTQFDRDLAEVETLFDVVLIRLRTWHRSRDRDGKPVRQTLQDAADAVVRLLNDPPPLP